jgi:hypothetical protein
MSLMVLAQQITTVYIRIILCFVYPILLLLKAFSSPKGLDRIAEICYGHLCLKKENKATILGSLNESYSPAK